MINIGRILLSTNSIVVFPGALTRNQFSVGIDEKLKCMAQPYEMKVLKTAMTSYTDEVGVSDIPIGFLLVNLRNLMIFFENEIPFKINQILMF